LPISNCRIEFIWKWQLAILAKHITFPLDSQQMRIIAGEFRGRSLLPPAGQQTTRPITDRAKQSLFDVLTPQIEGALVYDCFAGTGSLGLESLSRGAKFATFFEADRPAVTRLHQNIAALKVQDRSRVVSGDLFKWFELSTTRPDSTNASGADIVFLDPPYRFLRDRSDEVLQLALHLSHGHLNPNATVVFRHDAHDKLPLPNLTSYDSREYGDMTIELLRPELRHE
jgi:16S rRNA (guanine966-N2)-methyltransferase